ncbi:asparagine synthase-related protein [Arthrobacter sp. SA17]
MPTAATGTGSTGNLPIVRDPQRLDWTADDWQEALHESLRTAVQRRLVADVPVGVLLSGGLDSSLLVALLAEAGQPGLSTFSIGFDGAGRNPATSSCTRT